MIAFIEYAVCFSNADGGVVVFGVSDKTLGRSEAIHGAKGYNLDTWRRGIFDRTNPHIQADVEELNVPKGTGHLLIVRIPKGSNPPYGTSQGLFKQRVGKNCMPMDPAGFASMRASTGAVDWSGQPVAGITPEDLDPLEIARARAMLRSKNPEVELLKMPDDAFLRGLEAVRGDSVTNTGLLLFGKPDIISDLCPQSQVHYVHQPTETKVFRNDLWRVGLLQIIEKIESIFSGPINPEEEISVGLFKLRIPAFPLDVVREVVLNAVTHRDYTNPGEVLIRHATSELVVTSPGGFIGGITLQNILRHESTPRIGLCQMPFSNFGLSNQQEPDDGRYLSQCPSTGNGCPGMRLMVPKSLCIFTTARLIMPWRILLPGGMEKGKISDSTGS
nr:RNA-binding domain-containing protein [uncultured Methanospirillum sp.]